MDSDLFTASIIAVNRDYDNSSFHLFVVTECADFLKLRIPTLLSYPDIGGTLEVVDEAVNGDCFGSDTVCLQIWEIRSRGTLDCPPTNVPKFKSVFFNMSNVMVIVEELEIVYSRSFDHIKVLAMH